mmetsp:Transcript_94733/g.271772  ORF Transcript_94733/g.271772 Transcript_94733/m.271772 type:complete len:443 (+) Transcript_94733:559-1887(+)
MLAADWKDVPLIALHLDRLAGPEEGEPSRPLDGKPRHRDRLPSVPEEEEAAIPAEVGIPLELVEALHARLADLIHEARCELFRNRNRRLERQLAAQRQGHHGHDGIVIRHVNEASEDEEGSAGRGRRHIGARPVAEVACTHWVRPTELRRGLWNASPFSGIHVQGDGTWLSSKAFALKICLLEHFDNVLWPQCRVCSLFPVQQEIQLVGTNEREGAKTFGKSRNWLGPLFEGVQGLHTCDQGAGRPNLHTVLGHLLLHLFGIRDEAAAEGAEAGQMCGSRGVHDQGDVGEAGLHTIGARVQHTEIQSKTASKDAPNPLLPEIISQKDLSPGRQDIRRRVDVRLDVAAVQEHRASPSGMRATVQTILSTGSVSLRNAQPRLVCIRILEASEGVHVFVEAFEDDLHAAALLAEVLDGFADGWVEVRAYASLDAMHWKGALLWEE